MGIRWFAVRPDAVIGSASRMGDIARMVDGDGARLDSAMTQRTRNDVTAAQGKAVRYR